MFTGSVISKIDCFFKQQLYTKVDVTIETNSSTASEVIRSGHSSTIYTLVKISATTIWTSTGCIGIILIICIFSFGVKTTLFLSSNCFSSERKCLTLSIT